MMTKRILLGVGMAPYATVATRYAVELAQAHKAELGAIAIIDVERLARVGSTPIGASEAVHDLREHRLQEARRVVGEALAHSESACRSAGVVFQAFETEGDPLPLMRSWARYYDLLVCSPQGLFEHGVLEEAPEELIDLLIEGVRPILAVPAEHRPIRRVLIGYSGTTGSAKAMKRFAQMQLWNDVAVRLVAFSDGLNEDAAQLLQDAAAYCRAHGIDAEHDAVEGSPTKMILPYAADWDADLIVVGNSMKSLLRRRLFGETTLELLRHSDRALFLSQ